ncbi:MAG: hypothetical protein HC880_01745 [Bacteroidia bacterium]|nr:hypothetical protein [Bacteroidia bacterium]
MKGLFLGFLLLILFWVLPGAAASQPSTENDGQEVLDNIFKTIPSPFEISSLIKEEGVSYQGDILNGPQEASRYQSEYRKALNLGIYSTDLGYINIYKKSDSIAPAYLQSILTIANGLNIGQFINFANISQFALSNDLNGLLSETSSSFDKINQEFIDQQKPQLSVLMLTGGWLETLYLTCQAAKKTRPKHLMTALPNKS